MYKLIGTSGFLAFIFLMATVVLGVTRLNFQIHKLFGLITFTFGLVHLVLIVANKMSIKRKIHQDASGK